ncbi:uncharacterized protein GGS25DRAFT_519593 [Hypoxylon fragiforme]|uniref:uncharacterized protein n=1 Tax=Hypoxylon fragiforme TaxID=63214 RepID=UPI0020C64A76|nr:uncharacterized protein GGS25DRAFT_519593 [Hypoxylon fragiforme]KAI2611290.1 hypothetical protein GGS25DRAFT_519593 [Hypoxylon fragiforme]
MGALQEFVNRRRQRGNVPAVGSRPVGITRAVKIGSRLDRLNNIATRFSQVEDADGQADATGKNATTSASGAKASTTPTSQNRLNRISSKDFRHGGIANKRTRLDTIQETTKETTANKRTKLDTTQEATQDPIANKRAKLDDKKEAVQKTVGVPASQPPVPGPVTIPSTANTSDLLTVPGQKHTPAPLIIPGTANTSDLLTIPGQTNTSDLLTVPGQTNTTPTVKKPIRPSMMPTPTATPGDLSTPTTKSTGNQPPVNPPPVNPPPVNQPTATPTNGDIDEDEEIDPYIDTVAAMLRTTTDHVVPHSYLSQKLAEAGATPLPPGSITADTWKNTIWSLPQKERHQHRINELEATNKELLESVIELKKERGQMLPFVAQSQIARTQENLMKYQAEYDVLKAQLVALHSGTQLHPTDTVNDKLHSIHDRTQAINVMLKYQQAVLMDHDKTGKIDANPRAPAGPYDWTQNWPRDGQIKWPSSITINQPDAAAASAGTQNQAPTPSTTQKNQATTPSTANKNQTATPPSTTKKSTTKKSQTATPSTANKNQTATPPSTTKKSTTKKSQTATTSTTTKSQTASLSTTKKSQTATPKTTKKSLGPPLFAGNPTQATTLSTTKKSQTATPKTTKMNQAAAAPTGPNGERIHTEESINDIAKTLEAVGNTAQGLAHDAVVDYVRAVSSKSAIVVAARQYKSARSFLIWLQYYADVHELALYQNMETEVVRALIMRWASARVVAPEAEYDEATIARELSTDILDFLNPFAANDPDKAARKIARIRSDIITPLKQLVARLEAKNERLTLFFYPCIRPFFDGEELWCGGRLHAVRSMVHVQDIAHTLRAINLDIFTQDAAAMMVGPICTINPIAKLNFLDEPDDAEPTYCGTAFVAATLGRPDERKAIAAQADLAWSLFAKLLEPNGPA